MREEVPLERAAIDLAGTPDRSAAWLLLADGAVARIEATGPPRAFGRVAGGVAIAGDIERLVVATASTLELRAVDGSSSHAVPLSADRVLDVALSANGQLVALGLRSGTVEIRSADDGSLLARLVGHRERVASVAITEHGIWSASWDGDVRVWDRAALALPAAEALAAAEARFGLGLDDVTRR